MAGLLRDLGFTADPEMDRTGDRFTEFLADWVPRGAMEPLSVFEVDASGPVLLRDLPFHSLCAHHLLPFFGTISVAYQPAGRVVGLGGLPRLVAWHARRPQLQERLAEGVAAGLEDAVAPRGVVVRLVARQLCVEMREAGRCAEFESWAERGAEVERLRALLR